MWADFISLLFPDNCLLCASNLVKGESKVCLRCWTSLPLKSKDDRESIELKFFGDKLFRSAVAYLKFRKRGIVQKLLHQVKYHGEAELAEMIGARFARAYRETLAGIKTEVIVPVPLHPRKQRRRGYNQSECFARGLASELDLDLDCSSLRRIRHNPSQTYKTREARWKTVSKAFQVTGKELEGKSVLLVDDVITTGATLQACIDNLRNAKVRSVSVAIIAEALK